MPAIAALPERLASSRNTLVGVFAGGVALLVVAWEPHAWWAVPTLLLSFLAAGWPLRRVLFGETWSLGAYLWFYVRLVLVIYGFLVSADGRAVDGGRERRPELAGHRGAGRRADRVERAQRRDRPRRARRAARCTAPALTERFSAIIGRSKIPAPLVEYVDLRGGVVVNAIALPDTDRPGVLFSSSLIDRLEEREVAAIFAHEMAHLEHFNRAFLAKLRWAGWVIIAAAVLAAPLVYTYAPDRMWLRWLWPIVVFSYIGDPDPAPPEARDGERPASGGAQW